jgi:hypothetical protein
MPALVALPDQRQSCRDLVGRPNILPPAPLRVFQQHHDGVALVPIGPLQPMRSIGAHRIQNRIAAAPFARIRADFRKPQFLLRDQPMDSIGKPLCGTIEDRAENFHAKILKPEPL